MPKSLKIRTLTAPNSDLSIFDPGAYFGALEFYETEYDITESDRNELAQFAHLLAFFALKANSTRWNESIVPRGSLALQALETHFSHLHGWDAISQDPHGVYYKDLACFLMEHYPPKKK